MGKTVVQLCLVIVGISGIHAVRLLQTASIHLRVYPRKAADKIRAIQGRDTIEMTDVQGEYYLRNINPGHWQILVEANSPYRNSRYDMNVKAGTDKDLGGIRLPAE